MESIKRMSRKREVDPRHRDSGFRIPGA